VPNINRRDTLKLLGAVPAAAVFSLSAEEAAEAAQAAQQARARAAASKQTYKPKFFTAHEYATVVLLGDLILPKDARGGSASDAGTPEFIDYIVAAQTARQTPMRGGLQWLDSECRDRFDKTFVQCDDAQRRQVLDDIAWPLKARPEMSQGARFFTTMRDLVATGYWSSKMGVADIGYVGNVMRPDWTGAPAEVLQKLGVSYE
jgi:gluconate 2-dehydrogenase subunit 3-like protein